jgi:hypothetical protein
MLGRQLRVPGVIAEIRSKVLGLWRVPAEGIWGLVLQRGHRALSLASADDGVRQMSHSRKIGPTVPGLGHLLEKQD